MIIVLLSVLPEPEPLPPESEGVASPLLEPESEPPPLSEEEPESPPDDGPGAGSELLEPPFSSTVGLLSVSSAYTG